LVAREGPSNAEDGAAQIFAALENYEEHSAVGVAAARDLRMVGDAPVRAANAGAWEDYEHINQYIYIYYF
jgi:hypothetical protein